MKMLKEKQPKKQIIEFGEYIYMFYFINPAALWKVTFIPIFKARIVSKLMF